MKKGFINYYDDLMNFYNSIANILNEFPAKVIYLTVPYHCDNNFYLKHTEFRNELKFNHFSKYHISYFGKGDLKKFGFEN